MLSHEPYATINHERGDRGDHADISGRPANTTPQVSLTPEAVADDNLPVCREYSKMERGEKDVVLRRMQDDHGDTMTPIVARISVNLFCKLNPGRLIDGGLRATATLRPRGRRRRARPGVFAMARDGRRRQRRGTAPYRPPTR